MLEVSTPPRCNVSSRCGLPVRCTLARTTSGCARVLAVFYLERSGFRRRRPAGDVAQLLGLSATHADLVLTLPSDAAHPKPRGLDAARVIRDEFPDIGILVAVGHVDVDTQRNYCPGGRRDSATCSEPDHRRVRLHRHPRATPRASVVAPAGEGFVRPPARPTTLGASTREHECGR